MSRVNVFNRLHRHRISWTNVKCLAFVKSTSTIKDSKIIKFRDPENRLAFKIVQKNAGKQKKKKKQKCGERVWKNRL